MIDSIADVVIPVAFMAIPVLAAMWVATFVFGREETIGFVKRRSHDLVDLANVAVRRLARCTAILFGSDDVDAEVEQLSREISRLSRCNDALAEQMEAAERRAEIRKEEMLRHLHRVETALEQIPTA
jgi:outer membrane murein-binding lipoprotein Lpp